MELEVLSTFISLVLNFSQRSAVSRALIFSLSDPAPYRALSGFLFVPQVMQTGSGTRWFYWLLAFDAENQVVANSLKFFVGIRLSLAGDCCFKMCNFFNNVVPIIYLGKWVSGECFWNVRTRKFPRQFLEIAARLDLYSEDDYKFARGIPQFGFLNIPLWELLHAIYSSFHRVRCQGLEFKLYVNCRKYFVAADTRWFNNRYAAFGTLVRISWQRDCSSEN